MAIATRTVSKSVPASAPSIDATTSLATPPASAPIPPAAAAQSAAARKLIQSVRLAARVMARKVVSEGNFGDTCKAIGAAFSTIGELENMHTSVFVPRKARKTDAKATESRVDFLIASLLASGTGVAQSIVNAE